MKKDYSITLDIVRVLAMAGVLLVHFEQAFPMAEWIHDICSTGRYGVQAFFALSAYLACAYFMKPGASTPEYYKRRALRILPTYYAAILLCMVYMECIEGGTPADPCHLGWLRYFLGLQLWLPSDNFTVWNNCCAMWCMSDFLFFYAVIPLILKYVRSFRGALIFLGICMIVAILVRQGSKQLSRELFDEVRLFFRWNPLYQMQYFAVGIVTFFAHRENKIRLGGIIIGILALAHFKSAMMAAGITGLCILLVPGTALKLKGMALGSLRFVSKYSFHIYLTHMLALRAAGAAALLWWAENSPGFYAAKLAGALFLCVVLTCILELAQRGCDAAFRRKERS